MLILISIGRRIPATDDMASIFIWIYRQWFSEEEAADFSEALVAKLVDFFQNVAAHEFIRVTVCFVVSTFSNKHFP